MKQVVWYIDWWHMILFETLIALAGLVSLANYVLLLKLTDSHGSKESAKE